ncbi:hypothetical protein CTI12_AA261820 [Artemisia annua]|uniref:Uncharacterized protein n=1 Tax=Artemisia annua TaxID=35608 RepID=A0A2U1NIK2_ARTAN|nr:hypothetical protein CTI12_AA261820 [Artemisia annua]
MDWQEWRQSWHQLTKLIWVWELVHCRLPELGAKMIGALWKDEVQSDDIIGIHKMMKNLLLEGDLLRVKNVTLPKGTYVKLQPYTSNFLNTSDSKAM